LQFRENFAIKFRKKIGFQPKKYSLMDGDNEVEQDYVLAHGQDPYEEEDLAASGWSNREPVGEDQEGEDMEEDDILPVEPDVEWYLSLYDITDAQRVSLLRTYASYLVSKGKSGVHKPGPPSDLAKQARRQGRWAQ